MRGPGPVLVAVGLLLLLGLVPRSLGDPQIPAMGGVIIEPFQGSFRGVAADTDQAFVAVGETLSVATTLNGIRGTALEALVVKYNRTGAQQWNATFDFGAHDILWGVAIDGDANIYATGFSYGNGYTKGLVAKISGAGVLLWSRTFSFDNGLGTAFRGVVLDGDRLVAVGDTNVDLGGGVVKHGGCVVEYSTAGALISARYFVNGSQEESVWAGVSTASTDSYYVVGAKKRLGEPESKSLFVKVGPSGIAWQQESSLGSTLWSVADLDAHGYATGLSVEDGVGGINITKRADDGTFVWSRKYQPGLVPALSGRAIVADAGNVFSSALNGTAVEFSVDGSGNPLNYTLSLEFKLAEFFSISSVKYGSDGSLQWATDYSPAGYDAFGFANTLDSHPRLIVAGIRYDAVSNALNPLVVRYVNI